MCSRANPKDYRSTRATAAGTFGVSIDTVSAIGDQVTVLASGNGARTKEDNAAANSARSLLRRFNTAIIGVAGAAATPHDHATGDRKRCTAEPPHVSSVARPYD
jgi:hypothetical protein